MPSKPTPSTGMDTRAVNASCSAKVRINPEHKEEENYCINHHYVIMKGNHVTLSSEEAREANLVKLVKFYFIGNFRGAPPEK